MKRALVSMALLGVVSAASAGVTLFWSLNGLYNSNYFYKQTAMNFQPYFDPAPGDLTWTQLQPGGFDMFLWARFSPDWAGYQIFGLDLKLTGNAWTSPLQTAAYRQKWDTTSNKQRWDGTVGIPLDGVCAAVQSHGIIARDPGDVANNLQNGAGEVLLGAVAMLGDSGQSKTASVQLQDDDPPGQGFGWKDANGVSHYTLKAGDYNPVTPATVTWEPEPASLALLAFASLLLRRR